MSLLYQLYVIVYLVFVVYMLYMLVVYMYFYGSERCEVSAYTSMFFSGNG